MTGDRSGSFGRVGEQTEYRFAPVTAGRQADLAAFCDRYGKFGYCSCMRWRLRSGPFRELDRARRTAALLDLAAADEPAGVLAYSGGQPVGWCSIAPRDSYQTITAARVIPRLPGDGVWSVTCFFLAPAVRGRGLLPSLLAAAGYAAGRGAAIAEAYPWPGRSSRRRQRQERRDDPVNVEAQ